MLPIDMILVSVMYFLFFKQKTAYEMRISDWSSDVCSSDLASSRMALATSRVATTISGLTTFGKTSCTRMCSGEQPSECAATMYSRSRTWRVDRQSVAKEKSVSVRVDIGGRSLNKI